MIARGRRTWVEVSKSALIDNVGLFQRTLGPRLKIAPVIKANAYGHGMTWAATTLQKSQIWGFCVAYGSEALELLRVGVTKPILVLSAWERIELPELIKNGVHLVAWDRQAIDQIALVSKKISRTAKIHVKIDTGTSRLGIAWKDSKALLADIHAMPTISLVGLFSHLADSESTDLSFAKEQYRRFESVLSNSNVDWKHIACTAAALRLPAPSANLARLGIGAYGLWPSVATHRGSTLPLRPVLSWKTHLLQVKKVPVGTTIGYDRTFTIKKASIVGTLPIGYSDGYDRRASNRSHVMILGKRCPIIGRVSMNLTTVDISSCRNVKPGQEVTLIGPGITADELASDWGTIHYEIISRISPLIPRVTTV